MHFCSVVILDMFKSKISGKECKTWVSPGLSDVRATPHCLVSEFNNDDFPTFDLPIAERNIMKMQVTLPPWIMIIKTENDKLILWIEHVM